MTRKQLSKEWMDAVRINLIDIVNFRELEEHEEISHRFFSNLLMTFETLSKLKHNKFYNRKELETIYLLIKDNLYNINDLLITVNEPGLPALIYEVVFNIFEELFLLCEDYELFETAQNLLNFRDIWFSQFKVKIIKVTREQK